MFVKAGYWQSLNDSQKQAMLRVNAGIRRVKDAS